MKATPPGKEVENVDYATGHFAPHNDDAGKILRADVAFQYTKGSAGVKVILRSEADAQFATSVPNAWGWFGLLNDMITIYGGKMDDGKWGSNKLALNYTDTGFDNDNGLKVEIKPITGLSFGASFIPFNTENPPR